MKKSLVFMLVFLLIFGVSATASQGAGVLMSPGEHQWINQGDKLMYTTQWWSTTGSEKIEWLMDGVTIAEKPLYGQTSGSAYIYLYASDYPVKTFPSGEISSYEFGCRLYSVPTATAGVVPTAWDEAVVYICPPSGETAPESTLDVPPTITSLSWQKVTDYLGDEHLGIEAVWTPVEGAIGYEVFARIGAGGASTQQTECTGSSVLVGFHLPTEETTYYLKVRAATKHYVFETDEYDYLTGPFSPEASITVPASSSLSWETLGPLMTLQPSLKLFPMRTPNVLIPALTDSSPQTPSPTTPVTRRPQLKTKAPEIHVIIDPIPVITPTPEPLPIQPIQPIQPIKIPILPNPTDAPSGTVAPVLKIRP